MVAECEAKAGTANHRQITFVTCGLCTAFDQEERCQEAEEEKEQSAEEGRPVRSDQNCEAVKSEGLSPAVRGNSEDQLSRRNLQQKSVWTMLLFDVPPGMGCESFRLAWGASLKS